MNTAHEEAVLRLGRCLLHAARRVIDLAGRIDAPAWLQDEALRMRQAVEQLEAAASEYEGLGRDG